MPSYKAGTDRNQQGIYTLEDMVGQNAMVRVIDRFLPKNSASLAIDPTINEVPSTAKSLNPL